MRRSLVLTNETARHPLRAALPPLRAPGLDPNAARRAALREFLLSFAAFFLAAMAFIA